MSDSSKVGRHARAVLEAAEAFRAEVAGVRAEPDRLLALATARYQAVRDGLVAERLGAMPVDQLRDAGANLRLSTLKEAGYRTVADVARAGLEQLDGVPGVGRQSAEQILKVVRAVVDGVVRDTTVRLNPDRADRDQTELLQLLSKLRRANQLVGPLREPLADVLGRVDADVRAAGRAWSRLRMFFSSGRNRRAALESLDRLETLLGSRDATALRAVGAQLRVPDLDSRALWRDYELDAAAYNTQLADLAGVPDRSAAKGFVPSDIEHEVDATPLDTSLLKVSLRGYQVFGAKFALARKRVIIGDEMGLGKTIEAIAVMANLAAGGRTGFLVVCPASVVVNWVNEIARHSDLVPHRLHGAGRDSAVGEWLARGGVGVTTFGTLPKLVLPKKFRPTLVVVDEAHYVKNPDTQRSQAVNALVQRAERAILLTGTPMENRVEEFRNLVAYLQPSVAARTGSTDAVVGAKAFRRVVAPVYLRRNQEDVLGELPELLEVEDWVEFGKQDRGAYLDAVREGNLMAMRRAAFTPRTPRTPRGSAKLERLLEIVEESRDNGWKVVVFSYFHDVLDAVAEHVEVFGPLTGATSAQGRQQLVDSFTACEGHAVLLAQIEAGGVGLNIQAASVVIIAEPQWKPSTEDQAIARCHRMGQVRKVHVHRLLVKDSVDARVREIRDHKTLLFDHYARESDTKHSSASALDSAVSVEQRVVQAEQQRLGL
ncbi:DEAD/DEAH box helicase [Lentzea sp. JNUCC 0626]|uniref:DEAD/DEAH box helicase n=1 Tax=Lentzea sp. JNUCC 0626 TaxID=3367513 RepID=UPI0037484058